MPLSLSPSLFLSLSLPQCYGIKKGIANDTHTHTHTHSHSCRYVVKHGQNEEAVAARPCVYVICVPSVLSLSLSCSLLRVTHSPCCRPLSHASMENAEMLYASLHNSVSGLEKGGLSGKPIVPGLSPRAGREQGETRSRRRSSRLPTLCRAWHVHSFRGS